MPAGTYNDLQKRIDQWTQDMLKDDEKMDAWVTMKKLNELERKRIIAEVNKKKRLDELFGVK